MKKFFNTVPKIILYFAFIAMIGIAQACSLIPHGASGKNIIGNWKGNLKIPTGEEIRIELEIFTNADGDYRAFIQAPEQDDSVFFIDNLSIKGKIVNFSVWEIQGDYKATITDKNRIDGEWSQSEQTFSLVFERVE
ncbi:hypothetical protein ACFL4V_00075 [Candidatus Latescibacterota bacterium]